MPEMDGFQFLIEFNKLKNISNKCVSIYMLSSSTNPEDIQRAKHYRHCIGFLNKPLTYKSIENIIFNSMYYKITKKLHESGIDTYCLN